MLYISYNYIFSLILNILILLCVTRVHVSEHELCLLLVSAVF